MKKYLTADKIEVDKNIINIKGFNLEVINLNGFIYRGDTHNTNVLRMSPAFYGDLLSSIEYIMSKHGYLKIYKTQKNLRLLCLGKSNHKNINRFFREYLIEYSSNNKIMLKMTHIMLQVLYGMIDNEMNNLDLWDLSLDEIKNYFKYFKVEQNSIDVFIYIITKLNKNTIEPSRISIRDIDKVLMQNISSIFVSYMFNGIWYFDKQIDQFDKINLENIDESIKSQFESKSNILCKYFDNIFYKNKNVSTCVPSEMCIFTSVKVLKLIDIIMISE